MCVGGEDVCVLGGEDELGLWGGNKIYPAKLCIVYIIHRWKGFIIKLRMDEK